MLSSLNAVIKLLCLGHKHSVKEKYEESKENRDTYGNYSVFLGLLFHDVYRFGLRLPERLVPFGHM